MTEQDETQIAILKINDIVLRHTNIDLSKEEDPEKALPVVLSTLMLLDERIRELESREQKERAQAPSLIHIPR